jgi:putative DNA-invertase from lambdoid prophage Rac
MSEKSKPVKAVAYARCSLMLKQDPNLQLINIREFAKARGFDLAQEYVDQIHGDRERRPGLDKLIADAKMGKFKVLICTGIDRMFRSTTHMLVLLDELHHYGVSLISIREQLDFSTPAGQMTLTVLAACATLEKQLISERIKTSLAAKKFAAQESGSGWRCGRPSVTGSEVTKRVIELREQGLSVRQIAKKVGTLSYGSVQRILKNHRE